LYNAADHHFLWLWGNIPHAEALDVLLTVAIPKNTLDDHYFIFPMFTWRALDWLGREHTSFLMRPAVRYVTRFPTPSSFKRYRRRFAPVCRCTSIGFPVSDRMNRPAAPMDKASPAPWSDRPSARAFASILGISA